MATFNKSFVAKNGIEPGSNNAVDLGTSTNQFKNTYSNSVVITGGVANTTQVMLYANGYANLSYVNVPTINSHTIVASNVSVTNFESITVTITDIEANTVTAESVTTNTLSFASANQSPNVSITVNGDMTGTTTAELTNLNTDAGLALQLTLNANQSFDYITSNTQFVNNYIDLNPIDHPAHNEGRLFYDNVHKTLNYYSDITNLNMELGTNEYIRVYNDTGNTIPNGAALYLSGYTSTNPVVPKAVLADATSAATYNTSGLAAASIPNGSYGYCAVSGVVRGTDSDPFDTSYLTAGQRAFVSATVPGQLQQPAPSYPNYPMCMGLVVIADANNGVFVVEQQMHAVPQFRVAGDVYVGQDLTVAGDFTVLGNETTVSLTNISVDDTFFYLGSGDTISNTEFVPADANTPGLNDALYSGYYEGTTTKTISVRIDSTGAPDTFEWSDDNFSTTQANNVAITGSAQLLGENIKITFSATTGHTLGDRWDGDVAPSDLDFGIIGNYSNSSLYSHAGFFRDASDNRFKFFKRYDPEIEGSVDITNSSFQYADVQVNSIFGHTVTANLVGTVTGIVTDISNHNTDDLTEGNTNLYYTTARANTDIDARVTTLFVNALDVDAQTVFGNTAADLLNFNNFTNLPSPNVSITVNGDVQGVATADLANLSSDAALSLSLELTDTGVVANTYGSGSAIPVITVDVDGRITNASIVSVTNTSTSNAVLGGNTVTFTRADSSTFDIDLADFRDYNSLINTPTIPANTSTTSVAYTVANNTLTFTRANASTFDVLGPFLPPTIKIQNITGTSTASSNSVAIGADANAYGSNSVAIGASANIGQFSTYGIAIGGNTSTNTAYGIAIGYNAIGTGPSSGPVSIGYRASSNGQGSVALGWYANASIYNIAIGGYANSSTGSQSVALGWGSNAYNSYCVSLGSNATTTHSRSVAIGHNATSTSANQIMLGTSSHFVQVPGDLYLDNGLKANGSLGTAGQILTSNGSSVYWDNQLTLPANTSTSNATWDDANNLLTFTRADASTFDVSISFAEYLVANDIADFITANDLPTNTSTSSAAYTVANNTLTLTRADASTFDVVLTGVANTSSPTFSGDVIVQGNLITQGTLTYLNTTQLQIEDNIITLAANQASGAVNAGIEVDRGSDANVSILWNETDNKWTLTNDGSTYANIAVVTDIPATPANTSTSNATWTSANSTINFTRADSSTFDVTLSSVNAAALGGLSSSQFLRSDADDTTSGDLTITKATPILFIDAGTTNQDRSGEIRFTENKANYEYWGAGIKYHGLDNVLKIFTHNSSTSVGDANNDLDAIVIDRVSANVILQTNTTANGATFVVNGNTTSNNVTIVGNTTANNISTEGNVYITDSNKLHIGGDSSNVVAYMEFNSTQNSIDWVVI